MKVGTKSQFDRIAEQYDGVIYFDGGSQFDVQHFDYVLLIQQQERLTINQLREET